MTAERLFWEEAAPPPPPAPRLEGGAACDVAVIGAGILGLSTALALAGAGVRVTVLEAGGIGAGASGRNGGLVVPSLPRIGPDDVLRAFGPDQGARFLRVVAGGAASVFALIGRHGIACDAVQSGWLQPAHAAVLAPRVRARAAVWAAAGGQAVWLDAAETRRRMGSHRFHGALFDATGGHLNPLAYARGLAGAAMAAGAAVHPDSPVIGAEPAPGGWRLRTPAGLLLAARVLQASNGAALPGQPAAYRAATVPLTVFQLATPPLPDAARRAVLPGNEAFSDTRNNLLACRWTADGRLVTGGMASVHACALDRLPRRLGARLASVFPALAAVPGGGVRFSHIWRGRAALTGDFLPRALDIAPGWLAVTACNGRGIALNTALGPHLAAFLAGGGAAALPLPVIPPRPVPWRPVTRWLPQLLLPLGDWQDRRAERAPAAE